MLIDMLKLPFLFEWFCSYWVFVHKRPQCLFTVWKICVINLIWESQVFCAQKTPVFVYCEKICVINLTCKNSWRNFYFLFKYRADVIDSKSILYSSAISTPFIWMFNEILMHQVRYPVHIYVDILLILTHTVIHLCDNYGDVTLHNLQWNLCAQLHKVLVLTTVTCMCIKSRQSMCTW